MGPHRLPRRRPRPGARPAAEQELAQGEQQQPKAHHQEPRTRTAGVSRNLLTAALLGVWLLVLAATPPLARAQEAAAVAEPTPFAVAAEAAAGEEEPLLQSSADEGIRALDQLDVAFTYAKTDKRAIAGFQTAITQLLAPFGKWVRQVSI